MRGLRDGVQIARPVFLDFLYRLLCALDNGWLTAGYASVLPFLLGFG
jgi:hypothetical protein